MNVIVDRISNFLIKYAPFNNLPIDDIKKIVLSIHVINLEKSKSIFQINDKLHDSFYIVASGTINLTVISDSEEILLNKCATGDVFGLRPFFAKNNYQMTAKASEDSILYAIPISTFKPYVAKNENVLNFLLESFANNSVNPADTDTKNSILAESNVYGIKSSEIQYFQTLLYNKSPFVTSSSAIAKDVAVFMSNNMIDYVLVAKDNLPIGIVTDRDMCIKIVTGRFDITTTLQNIMSSPVITVSENVSLAEAQLLFLKHNVSHLCVTQDGTDKSTIKGIITQRDLILAQASNPGVLIKEIKKCDTVEGLQKSRLKLISIVQKSISKNIPIYHLSKIVGEINDAIIKRAIELVLSEFGSAPSRFSWFSIGSQGRKEQLILEDYDSIIVFEDVATDKYNYVQDYYIKLGNSVSNMLFEIGYFPDNESIKNYNSDNCKSLKEWAKVYNIWINTPSKKNNVNCNAFFDLEIVYGDSSIEIELTDYVFKNVNKNNLFFDYLGNDALRKPPPLSFFKKFNVEELGENKDKFDIYNKAMLPLVDGARLLTLSNNVRGINNTYSRFKHMAMIDPKHSEIYINCAEAFLYYLKIKTLEGLKNENDGQFIDVEQLPKIDKERLKNELNSMKDLEEFIKDNYQLTHFS
jgi:CBS domain-containing protein